MTKENGLPDKITAKWPTVSTEPVVSKQIFYHNWLYSVVPARMSGWQVPNNTAQIDIYLTGYCRNCGRAFSAPIQYGSEYLETTMNVKKEGCISPE